MVTTVKNKRESVITWDQYETPKDSALGNPYLTGKIECYVNQIGPANGRIKFDLVAMDVGFEKLSAHGKHLFAHGVKQKAVDGTGKKTPNEVYTILRATRDRLEAGHWNAARDSVVARRLNMLAVDMAVAKFSVKFTEKNRNAMIVLVSSADEEKIKGWLDTPQVAAARADREAREAEVERKLAAEKLKAAGEVELTF